MPTPEPIIAELAAARRSAGLSQGALARRIGVSDRSVCSWETGRAVPAVDHVAAYAAAVGRRLVLVDEALYEAVNRAVAELTEDEAREEGAGGGRADD